jgi:uncharacterized membrane protein
MAAAAVMVMHHPDFPSIPADELEHVTGAFNWAVIGHNKSQAKAKEDAMTASILSPKSGGAGGGGGGGGGGGKAGKVDASAGLGAGLGG